MNSVQSVSAAVRTKTCPAGCEKLRAQQEDQDALNSDGNTEDDDAPTPVRQRRTRRQLNGSVRITDGETQTKPAVAAPVPVIIDNAPVAVPADTDVPAAAENNGDEAHSDNILPRRSRRSPRHLRVSGQRRRRYREDRQLTQSPVPLEMAVFSLNWLPVKCGSSIRLWHLLHRQNRKSQLRHRKSPKQQL